jgi:glutamate racemase
LATLVEQGVTELSQVRDELSRYLTPLLSNSIDTLVLGCTHYAMMTDAFRTFLPGSVTLIDPAGETVEQLQRLVPEPVTERMGDCRFFVTGSPGRFAHIAQGLLGWYIDVEQVSL